MSAKAALRVVECPDPVHAHPLPPGYVGAATEADRRLGAGWDNLACPLCGQYGWAPPPGDLEVTR